MHPLTVISNLKELLGHVTTVRSADLLKEVLREEEEAYVRRMDDGYVEDEVVGNADEELISRR